MSKLWSAASVAAFEISLRLGSVSSTNTATPFPVMDCSNSGESPGNVRCQQSQESPAGMGGISGQPCGTEPVAPQSQCGAAALIGIGGYLSLPLFSSSKLALIILTSRGTGPI